MIQRRLLMGGGGAFVQPPGAISILPAPSIGWTEVTGPHAIYSAGRTYITGVGGQSNPNDILVYAYVHATGAVEGPVLLSDNLTPADSSPDSHLGGAITINEDGYLVVAYCGHNATSMKVKISNNVAGATWAAGGFTAPISISTASVGTCTYPQLSYLTSNDRIYLTFRWIGGAGSGAALTYSDDGGTTWAALLNFYEYIGTSAVYSAFASNGVDRLDFAYTDFPADHVGGYGLWHLYMDETGDVFESDGTPFAGSFPLATSDMTELVAPGGDTYPYSVSYQAGGDPVIAVQTKNATPIEIGEWRWDGATWDYTQIDTSELYGVIESVGGGAHDWNDSERFISGKIISGTIYVYVYTRSGGVWTGVYVATATSAPSPVYVQDAGPELAWLWFASGFTDSDTFDPAIAGVA